MLLESINKQIFSANTRQIIILVILLLGLIIGVILVQKQQIFKSRADLNIGSNIEVTDPDGNQLNCSGTSCDTKSLDVKVKIKDLNSLIED